MRLILVRHGETDWNLKKRVQGQIDVSLNKKGREQAKKVALRLKSDKIDIIYSSNLKRARQTTAEIAKFHNAPVRYDNLLRERSFGKIEGIPAEEYRKIREKTGLPKYLYRPPGGENYLDLEKRIKKFLSVLKKNHRNKTILVVSHGGVIRVFITALTKRPLKSVQDMEQHNTAVNIIELRRGSSPRIHHLNSTEHL